MSGPEETVTVNPDGSTSYGDGSEDVPPTGEGEAGDSTFEEAAQEIIVKGTDPALYLLAAALLIGLLYYFYTRKSRQDADDDFFLNLDGEKFNLKLPSEVEEYEEVKKKCLASGWVPGKPSPDKSATGPQRVMAQALMKRSIADIPLVTHIQKESAGMNKLYAQSMCSVNQWRAYQAAEAMVSAEVDEVRAEADEIEPGWSQVIWRQAMQYHNMLKQKHEMEQKASAEAAAKRKAIEEKVNAAKQKIQSAEEEKINAERLARELIEEEERERAKRDKAFSGGSMKKGFLDKGKKK